MGGAWLTGGLHALARETGWDPTTADYIVGTSAGSMIGLAARRGRAALVHGRPLGGRELRRPARRATATRPPRPTAAPARRSGSHRGPPPIGPGLVEADRRALSAPHRHAPDRAPRRLAAARRDLHRAAQGHDPPRRRPGLERPPGPLGRRLRLRRRPPRRVRPRRRAAGRPGRRGRRLVRDPRLLPPGRHRRAAATSTAACGRPRTSTSCATRSSTWSSASTRPRRSTRRTRGTRPSASRGVVRRGSGRRLGWEARKLRQAGTELVLIQPTREDLDVDGRRTSCRRKRRHQVIETAIRTVSEQLRAPGVRELLADLPAGRAAQDRAPAGPPVDLAAGAAATSAPTARGAA